MNKRQKILLIMFLTIIISGLMTSVGIFMSSVIHSYSEYAAVSVHPIHFS